ncbi:MAG: elongation factor P [Candidatus Beckwithbacteria bacterium]|nr:elongation factor P [Candidatus Beckwithbacteria bacterium]
MLNVNQLRNGTAFEMDGQPYLVIKYEFTKMGRGNATIKVRVRNLNTQSVTMMGFSSGGSVDDIQLRRKKMQYLYADANNSVFMDPVSFEQIEIDNELIKEQKPYLADGLEVQVLFWDPSTGSGLTALSVELPPKLTFIVKETGPGEKGNSVSNMYKSAVLNNGLQVKIPLFIKQGEKVIIDTREGNYVSRA